MATNTKILGQVSAHPVKSFFVHMLTRDIELRDAILDLLDNCVDGVQRSETKRNLEGPKPYNKYWARIVLSEDEFRIEDNCGGIPWELHNYAFRLGRLKQEIVRGRRTIGTYGIGMKRAIFKIGNDCTVETHAKDASYRLHFSPDWMVDELNWDIPVEEIAPAEQHGTFIVVRGLRDTVRQEFSSSVFVNAFREALSTHYAYIIGKGFTVYLNGEPVRPKQIRLLFAKPGDESFATHQIAPFIYQATHKGVDVFLAVGFTRDIPSKEEAEESFEDYKEGYSSADAGWTVVCNDRTVLYADKSAVTGWGVSGVPQYHFQFIAISGIVVFCADDANLLPTTTTKRSIDAQSELYLQVRDKMIEGMKLFTSYTNAWKDKDLVNASRTEFRKTSAADLGELFARASVVKMTTTRGVVAGKQYKPVLPRPVIARVEERIGFKKLTKDIRQVSKYLFDTPDKKPSEVGEKCFDLMLEEAER
jgi:hypothetical protein